MKKTLAIILCLIFLKPAIGNSEILHTDFYYAISIVSGLLYCITQNLTDTQRNKADSLVYATAEERKNYAAWIRVNTEQGQLWAKEYLRISCEHEAEAKSLYKKAEESSKLSGIFLSIGAISLIFGIYKTLVKKEKKLKLAAKLGVDDSKIMVNYNF